MLRSALGATALGVVLALAACSPASNSSSSSSSATPDAAAPAKTADATPTAAPAAAPDASTPAKTADAPPAADAAAPAAALIALDVQDASGAKLSGDPSRGAKIFLQCRTCHSGKQGVNGTGPSLYGVIGRHSGSIPNFKYSDANKNSGITWTQQELFTYLENPQKRVPGTKMTFQGLKVAQQRADVIAYLKVNAEQP